MDEALTAASRCLMSVYNVILDHHLPAYCINLRGRRESQPFSFRPGLGCVGVTGLSTFPPCPNHFKPWLRERWSGLFLDIESPFLSEAGMPGRGPLRQMDDDFNSHYYCYITMVSLLMNMYIYIYRETCSGRKLRRALLV